MWRRICALLPRLEGDLLTCDKFQKYCINTYHLLGSIVRTRVIRCTEASDFQDVFDSFHVEPSDTEDELNVIGQPMYFMQAKFLTGLPSPTAEEEYLEWLKLSTERYEGFQVDSIGLNPPFASHDDAMTFKEGFMAQYYMQEPRILCLTEDATNRRMWDHYAGGHRGIAIGFDTASGLFTRTDGNRLRPVIYSDTPSSGPREVANWRKWLIKHTDYSYEKEWRALFWDAQLEKLAIGKDSYIEVTQVPSGSIRQVVFGIRASEETIEMVTSALEPGVEIFRCGAKTGTLDFDLIKSN